MNISYTFNLTPPEIGAERDYSDSFPVSSPIKNKEGYLFD
jgi:hypothetical protein